MAWADLFAGVAFYLIIEGLFPFAMPGAWRRGLAALGQVDDTRLRVLGLLVMALGLGLLFIVRG
ncbi:MAG TPA: DUF2065 domain-containing protein [Gammaproteobacteria bacterium]